MAEYPILLFWTRTTSADVTGLHYCSAHTETPDEAHCEIEVARERLDPLPSPTRFPVGFEAAW